MNVVLAQETGDVRCVIINTQDSESFQCRLVNIVVAIRRIGKNNVIVVPATTLLQQFEANALVRWVFGKLFGQECIDLGPVVTTEQAQRRIPRRFVLIGRQSQNCRQIAWGADFAQGVYGRCAQRDVVGCKTRTSQWGERRIEGLGEV